MTDKPQKPKRAVALHYDGEKTPTITAKGQFCIAEQILAIAKEHGVMIHQDPQLTDLLSTLELNDEIPEILYVSIAKIIAFAYMLNGKIPGHTAE